MAKILIIEDDEMLARMYTRLLTAKQHVALSARDGKIGLTLAQSEIPDLIILDIMLPGGMNGFDVLEELKRNTKTQQVPVLILTNLDSEEKVAKEIGVVDYLIKVNNPPERVIAKIDKMLDTHNS